MEPGTPEAVTPIVAAPSASRSFDIVAAGIMVSRIAGFARNWAAARYLGTGVAADALRVASIIPNIIRNLLGEGAISASFIPVYSGLLARGDERGARALAGALLGFLLAAVSLLTLAGVAAAPVLTSLLASGWDDPEKIALTNRLLRILFPMAGLMVISGWCLGIQNAHRDYFMSYASAAVWSIVQIVLLFGWGSRAGDATSPALFGLGYRTGDTAQLAVWLAWAMVGGSIAQIAVQLPKVLTHVRPLRVSLDRDAPGLRQTLRNFLPVVISLGVVQISGLVDLTIASYLPDRAPSSLGYAALIYMLPGSVFAISVAASSLPDFSRDATGAVEAVRARLREGWLRILFYIIPTTALYVVYGDLVVSILLRSGRFGSEDTQIVRWIVAGYSVGLIGFSSVRLLASAFHAFQDYRTPLRASIAAITTSAVLALSLALPFRESIYATVGLGIASAIGSYVNLSILLGGLHKRLGALFTPAMWASTARIAMAAGVATLAAYPVRQLLAERHYLITAAGTLTAFGGIFLIVAYAAGSHEAERWLRKLRVVRRSP